MRVVEPKTHRWTRDEYYRMAGLGFFLDRRVELIQGEVIEMSPNDPPHAASITLLDYRLKRIFRMGFIVRIQSPISLGLDSDPEPDIAVVKGTLRDFRRSHPNKAVLNVEVAGSSLEYDRTRKASLYAEAGIQDYWIVNLVDMQLEVYRKPRKDPMVPFGFLHAQRTVLSANECVSPLALPGVAIPVDELLP